MIPFCCVYNANTTQRCERLSADAEINKIHILETSFYDFGVGEASQMGSERDICFAASLLHKFQIIRCRPNFLKKEKNKKPSI